MGLNIILDKSTFQSLSYKELVRLNNYYKHNVAPILVMEILGDLKKENAEGKAPSDVRVKDFANKLFPSQTVTNTYYRNVLRQELLGAVSPMDGRPHLDVEKVVQTDDGRKGFVIQETPEEKSIYKWKEGNFTKADHELSKLWRSLTTQEDILKKLQKTIQDEGFTRIKSLEELNNKVDEILNDVSIQDRLLQLAIEIYGDGLVSGMEVFKNWLNKGRPLLAEILPFVMHCLKVDLLFHFGLQSELIGTKPTNKVDLEYLYYLPFCNIFSSNDKIHKQLAPLLVKKYQRFIIGSELKGDLKMIVEFMEKEDEATNKEFASRPPIIEDSLTFQLWKYFFDYPEAPSFKRKPTEKEIEKAKEQMKKLERAMQGENVDFGEFDSEEFILKQSTISANDPCLCGSGKRVIDCCISKEEFIRISKEQQKRK